MKLLSKITLIMAAVLTISCSQQDNPYEKKVWAWMSGKVSTSDDVWENYFSKAAEAGIDAIILECHSGIPEILDSTTFRDDAAIKIINNALPYAQKHGIELHAWIWTTNRGEMTLRNAHPDWYQVNALGESCLDIKLYNREHYRWLCPSRPETLEYLKDRVAELGEIDGLAGIHLDFIRYPDVILPYGLHESRGVVQDRVYPQWDFCYCDKCREEFKKQTGIDPIALEDPTSNPEWMQYRWDALSHVASELCKEIKKHGKTASAAVFATPEESKKLVRQDWANFRNIDIIFPMIYHKFYNWDDPTVETATREGVEALKAADNPAYLCSGLFIGHVPFGRISEFFEYAQNGGSTGICLFSLEGVERASRNNDYWGELKTVIENYKQGTKPD